MSYLLFMDESGHDHRNTPYEVIGGVAIHSSKLWSFNQAVQALEETTFGDLLHRYQTELKGSKLLNRKRFRWAAQAADMEDVTRQKLCQSFLRKGLRNQRPVRREFTAYGQACLRMAEGIFRLLMGHDARVFASAIPRSARRPPGHRSEAFLRKDMVFLLERFFYFLEEKQETGLLVIDETDKNLDRKFIRRLHAYFTRTEPGRQRTVWIVPSPFFVSSDMSYPVQSADICMYCINWGFRLPSQGMDEAVRNDIAGPFGPLLKKLQFSGQGYRDGKTFSTHGIKYVEDPYGTEGA